MASSPETDHEPRPEDGSPQRQDNPFIKFRRFADAQVGSILQGLIGLPSTFSRTGENPRWADFDDDLRRRDELQAKQKKLKEADEGYRREAKADIPVANTRTLPEKSQRAREKEYEGYFPSNETVGRDIPLYSPVLKELFVHISGVNSSSWGLSNQSKQALRSKYLPFEVLDTQNPANVIQEIQCMAYNELNKRPFLRSEYSLLPYLLFSPYSPIRLEDAAKTHGARNDAINSSRVDNFPYSIAFEDLLQTSHGSFQKAHKYYHPFERLHPNLSQSIKPSTDWMGWIHNLYGINLLQQKQVQEMPTTPIILKGHHVSPFAIMHQEIINDEQGKLRLTPDAVQAPQTEQDMYDQLATWVSSPSAMVGSLASMLQDPERWLNEKMKILDSEKGHKIAKRIMDENLPREFLDMAAQMDSDMLQHRIPAELQEIFNYINGKSDAPQNPEQKERQLEELKSIMRLLLNPEWEQRSSKSASESSLWVPDLPADNKISENAPSRTDNVEASDARVVSTSTTTEQTTHEDGSTETCVTVWKRYSDGRESTTTTNHFSNPACDENGNPVEPEEQKPHAGSQQSVQEKKGWFWN